MHTVTVNDLQNNLNDYLAQVKLGEEIIIEDKDEIIARILPFGTEDEESHLVAEGLMRLPKKELTGDFWEQDSPEIPLKKIVEAIRNERDED